MKPSVELRVFLKHLPPEYRHAARVAYWIGANDALKSFRGIVSKSYDTHEAHHPEAGTERKAPPRKKKKGRVRK